MAHHRHRPVESKRQEWGYQGSVSIHRQVPEAHGGIRIEDECSCGAKRLQNHNGGTVESSGWFYPDSDAVGEGN